MSSDKQHRKELRDVFAPRTPRQFFSYGRGPVYRVAHACFDCRRSLKIASNPDVADAKAPACPGCAAPLSWMGRSFKAPRRSDTEQWKKVEALWRAGFRFHSYRSCPGAEPLPNRLRDVEDFIRRNPAHPMRVRAAGG